MITKEEFRLIRESLRLSQSQLGEKIDLSREFVGLIERGQKDISEGISARAELLVIKEKKLLVYENVRDLLNLQNKTSPASNDTRDGKKVEIFAEDIIASLEEIKNEQKKMSANFQTISDLLLQEQNMPSDKEPSLTIEQISAAVQQMIDQGSYGPKQSDFSQEELKEIAKGANNSRKHEVPGKSKVSSDAKKAERSHETEDLKRNGDIPGKGGASRK